MIQIINDSGTTRAVDLKGDRKGSAFYRTIQCTSGGCTCKYQYAATGRHKLYNTKDIKPFEDVCDWLHQTHKMERKEYFDEIVANIYSRTENQYAGYHTDQSDLLGATSDIVSLSMGAAGVFFWRPSPDGPLRSNGEGWAKEVYRHDAEKKAGLWGCVPLFPGDLFLCCGTFQHHLLHGSLKYTEAANVDEVTVNYSMCSEATMRLYSPEYRKCFDQSRMQPDRSVITFRRIENHYPACPESPSRPVAALAEHFSTLSARGSSSNASAPPATPAPPAHQVPRLVHRYESIGNSSSPSSRTALAPPAPHARHFLDTFDPVLPPESEQQGVWAHPKGVDRRIARGDRQDGVIPAGPDTSETPQLLPRAPNQPPPADVGHRDGLLDEVRRPAPQPPRDNAVSPAEVDHTVPEEQGEEAERCMRACREMIDRLEDMLEETEEDTQVRITETLAEMAAKISACARVQNIAKCRLEVAAPLYLIFKMIIPMI